MAEERAVEVLVVENGSTDGTARVTREFAAEHPFVRLIEGVERGKGVAVRTGMLEARGELRFLCDADLSMPIDQIARFIPAVAEGRTVAIGSREAAGARRHHEPGYRHFMGRVFNMMVKVLAVPGVEDTQCGFKMFPAEAAADVFQPARLKGWGFDPEVLYIARKRGYRLVEVGVDWYYNDDSRVRAIADSVGMVGELLQIRLNDWRGRYDGS
jgi:glycosyltransferase involved in cell wall biosynthesis